jgi:hypothetical protein
MTSRISRPLDATELRVLGCLLEKEQATPDYYPLTLNSLTAACNQRSNRYPVLNLTERDVQTALRRLSTEGLVRREEGSRADKWRHRLTRAWGLTPSTRAALTILLLRGAQTAGEVRARAARLHGFGSSAEAEAALAELAGPPDPLINLLEREPGQKEARWGHILGDGDEAVPLAAAARPPLPPEREFDLERMNLRIKLLEEKVHKLEAALEPKHSLGD